MWNSQSQEFAGICLRKTSSSIYVMKDLGNMKIWHWLKNIRRKANSHAKKNERRKTEKGRGMIILYSFINQWFTLRVASHMLALWHHTIWSKKVIFHSSHKNWFHHSNFQAYKKKRLTIFYNPKRLKLPSSCMISIHGCYSINSAANSIVTVTWFRNLSLFSALDFKWSTDKKLTRNKRKYKNLIAKIKSS